MKNIHWPPQLHWKIARLIKVQPILKSSKKEDIYWQKAVIESEIEHTQWLLDNTEEKYNNRYSSCLCKFQLEYALAQLNLQ